MSWSHPKSLRPGLCSRTFHGSPVLMQCVYSKSFALTTTAGVLGLRGGAVHPNVLGCLSQQTTDRSWSLSKLEFSESCCSGGVHWCCFVHLWTLALICMWEYFWIRSIWSFTYVSWGLVLILSPLTLPKTGERLAAGKCRRTLGSLGVKNVLFPQ